MLSEPALRDLRAFHRALGDVTRLRIVQLLAAEGELVVSEIARRLRVSQPLLTWHLHRLKRSGVVRAVRVGREVRCSFDRERFAEMSDRGARLLTGPASIRAERPLSHGTHLVADQ